MEGWFLLRRTIELYLTISGLIMGIVFDGSGLYERGTTIIQYYIFYRIYVNKPISDSYILDFYTLLLRFKENGVNQ